MRDRARLPLVAPNGVVAQILASRGEVTNHRLRNRSYWTASRSRDFRRSQNRSYPTPTAHDLPLLRYAMAMPAASTAGAQSGRSGACTRASGLRRPADPAGEGHEVARLRR